MSVSNMIGLVVWGSIGVMCAYILLKTFEELNEQKNAKNVLSFVVFFVIFVLLFLCFYIDIGGKF